MNLNEATSAALERVVGWAEALVANLPNFAAAVLVVVGFWLLARLARSLAGRLLGRVSDHANLNRLLATLGYGAVLATGLFVALGILNLDKTVTSLLAGVGIIGLALGFAFQDTAENFIAGILLSVRRPFADHDIIETNGHMGTVERITLRTTVLRTFAGQIVHVPNSEVFQNPVVNFSRTGTRRVEIAVGVSYDDDLEEAKRIAVEAVEQIESRDRSRDVELFYEEFGGSSINFKVRFWIDFAKQVEYLAARSEGIMRIKRAFDENGISIPFPIRTLDFGSEGGRMLSEALELARS